MPKVYISRYIDAPPRIPSEPSQAVEGYTIESARAMFAGLPVVSEHRRRVVFNAGGDQRIALTDYAVL